MSVRGRADVIDLNQQQRIRAAKFAVPAAPRHVLDRRDVHATLDIGVQGPLTLVTAPAGMGKTTAVATWTAKGHLPGPLVWVGLDPVDLAAHGLWTLVCEGLGRVGIEVPRPARAAARGTGDDPLVRALSERIAALPVPVVLVLDCDGAIPRDDARALDLVLRRSGDRLRLVLLSRTDPLLPLHRYRLSGSLTEIRMTDLALPRAQTRQFLAMRGLDLTEDSIDVAQQQTHGWVAGLVMLSMFLASHSDPEAAVREFTGDTGTVAEYLLAEVLDAQTPAARRVLLDTSVADLLRPGLSEALAGRHAQRALTFLANGNAFLEPVADSAGCYRYHPLFRELLHAQLSYESPNRVAGLHNAAAGWMAEHGYLDAAVRHACRAEAWDDAAGYVVDNLAVGLLLISPEPVRLTRELGHMPPGATGPSAAIVQAARLLAALDTDGAGERVAAARRQMGRVRGGTRLAAELALSVVVAAHADAVGDTEAALEACAAASVLRLKIDPARLAAHPEIGAILSVARGNALTRIGDLDAAADAFAEGSAEPVIPGREAPIVVCLGNLALIAAWRGQLRKAAGLAERATALRTDGGLEAEATSIAPDVAMAWVDTERYDLTGARSHALHAVDASTRETSAMPHVMLALLRARTTRAHGDPHGASALLSEAVKAHPDAPSWLLARLQHELAALSGGSSASARPAPGPDESVSLGRKAPLDNRVTAWLVDASRRVQHGDERRAVRALEQSLQLAAPEMLRRPFREAPVEVRRLLRDHHELTQRHRWLGSNNSVVAPLTRVTGVPRQRSAPRPDVVRQGAPVDPLTAKELEVLGHLAELLTTEEIASVMFVSVNTVRTHVRNILRKLSASRRYEAVRRARELHILPS